MSDRDDDTRYVDTRNRVLGGAQTVARESQRIGQAGHEVPRASVKAGSTDLHQHVMGADHGSIDLARVKASAVPYFLWTIARICWPDTERVLVIGCL